MSVIITEFSNSLIITQGWTHWTERLTNIWLTQTHRGGDALDGKTNKHRHKGGDTPDGKTNKHLATESQGGDALDGKTNHLLATTDTQGGTHRTERLTHIQLYKSRSFFIRGLEMGKIIPFPVWIIPFPVKNLGLKFYFWVTLIFI